MRGDDLEDGVGAARGLIGVGGLGRAIAVAVDGCGGLPYYCHDECMWLPTLLALAPFLSISLAIAAPIAYMHF